MPEKNPRFVKWLEKHHLFRTEAVQERRFEVAPSKGDGFIQRELPL